VTITDPKKELKDELKSRNASPTVARQAMSLQRKEGAAEIQDQDDDVSDTAILTGASLHARYADFVGVLRRPFLDKTMERKDIPIFSVSTGEFAFLRDDFEAVCGGHFPSWTNSNVHKFTLAKALYIGVKTSFVVYDLKTINGFNAGASMKEQRGSKTMQQDMWDAVKRARDSVNPPGPGAQQRQSASPSAAPSASRTASGSRGSSTSRGGGGGGGAASATNAFDAFVAAANAANTRQASAAYQDDL
jgi:hypothetical protein